MPQSKDCISVSDDLGRNLTPIAIIEAVRAVLGSIKLDPASDEVANRTIQAQRFYSAEQDGFNQPWNAETLWLNPPGRTKSQGKEIAAAQWGQRLLRRYQAGHFQSAIYLCYRGGSIGSIAPMASYGLVCLTSAEATSSAVNGSGRLSFEKVVDGERRGESKNTQSSAIFLLSHDEAMRRRFAVEFSKFGQVLAPFGEVA